MKKFSFFSLAAIILLLSAILSSEMNVLANALVLSGMDAEKTVPCFKTFTIDSNQHPDQSGELWAKANRCSDCKSYFFTHVSEQDKCIPTTEGTIQ